MIVTGQEQDVLKWDTQHVVNIFNNEYNTQVTSLTIVGNIVAVGYDSGIISMWNTDTNQYLGTIIGHNIDNGVSSANYIGTDVTVFDMASIGDNNRFVSASWDGTARIWSSIDGACNRIYIHDRAVISVGVISM
jgi:WD40 repeat protein